MRETNFEPFTKMLVIALCALLICGGVCAVTTASDDDALVGGVSQPQVESARCTFTIPQEVTKSVNIITPVPIIEEPEQDINPYADLDITDSEKELLACMVYNEARGEPFDGQVAVVQVALNRYMHEAFDGSISDILLAPNQFSVGKFYDDGQMKAVEAALAGEPALDLNTDVVFFSTGSLTYGSYYKTIGGHVFRTYF